VEFQENEKEIDDGKKFGISVDFNFTNTYVVFSLGFY
jgi:hypothetical protein